MEEHEGMVDRPHDPRMGDEDRLQEQEDRELMDDEMTMSNGGAPDDGEPPYGLIERQVVFKLLAAHALVDPEFYRLLREDPALAVEQQHIYLEEKDIEYIKGIVEWPVLDKYAAEVRRALHTEAVVRSLW